MTAQLLLTCLCDALYGEVGIATVRILEHCGVKVVFPEDQTCCGQPPFNSGDWATARVLAQRTRALFDPAIPIVVPSSSCAAMLRHGYAMLMEKPSDQSEPTRTNPNPNAFELSEFLLDVLGVDRWPLRGSSVGQRKRVVFHSACHGRVLELDGKPQRLLSLMPGLEIVEPDEPEQCCGFGGAFSLTHGTISEGIGLRKLQRLQASGADVVASTDMGCLLHLKGLASRQEIPIQFIHYAQVLAEAIA